MRHWLLVFLVLLLPLRGWAGDAMAGQMLQQHTPAHVHEQAAAPDALPGHDCDHHGTEAGQAQDAPLPASDCPTCASCQACSSVALSTPAVTLALARCHHPAPCAAQPACTSAEPTLAFKPPRG
jgi:hypothetical protein